jgi:acetyl esterase/lipase
MVLALVVAASEAQVGIDYEVQRAVEYGQHDGVKLTGDLYTPKAAGNYPGLIAVHGGGLQAGDAGFYQYWGPYVAERGYVLFSVNYRLVREGTKMYPEAVH